MTDSHNFKPKFNQYNLFVKNLIKEVRDQIDCFSVTISKPALKGCAPTFVSVHLGYAKIILIALAGCISRSTLEDGSDKRKIAICIEKMQKL